MAFAFSVPRATRLGQNSLEECGELMKSFGTKALIVTGKIITKLGTVAILTDKLEKWNIEYEIFNDITAEPTVEMIEEGVKAYQRAGCDFIIGIGGGSPLDSAKAIAAMAVLPGTIGDYLGKELQGDFPPMVLIPTTAGTGSEATKFTVITDEKKGIKMLLKGEALLPDLAVIDPELSRTAPKNITAATGMDALTHAVEAYTSRRANPISDPIAVSAVKRIFAYLPKALRDPEDRKAREEMAIAAYEAGICINNSSVTLVHGMSRPIGARFHVPHGLSNAMLLQECLAFALDGSYERFGTLGRAIGAAPERSSNREAAQIFLRRLGELIQECGIPRLKDYGIEKQSFEVVLEQMAEDAMNSGSPGNTLKDTGKQDLILIYRKLWE